MSRENCLFLKHVREHLMVTEEACPMMVSFVAGMRYADDVMSNVHNPQTFNWLQLYRIKVHQVLCSSEQPHMPTTMQEEVRSNEIENMKTSYTTTHLRLVHELGLCGHRYAPHDPELRKL